MIRQFKCSGTTAVPHEEVLWSDTWRPVEQRWGTPDGNPSPCWLCERVPYTALSPVRE